MSNIHCTCGHVFSDGEIPCPYAYTLISDGAIDDVIDGVTEVFSKNEDVGAAIGFIISAKGVMTYRCPRCWRLLIFENGVDRPATIYQMESKPV